MTDIEAKALALVNEMRRQYPLAAEYTARHIALCRAIEQHEAFKQAVSDAVKDLAEFANDNPVHLAEYLVIRFSTLISPEPKPDPLVQAMNRLEWCNTDALAKDLRAELDAFGLEIREKNDD
jgi:hypothetical protein